MKVKDIRKDARIKKRKRLQRNERVKRAEYQQKKT